MSLKAKRSTRIQEPNKILEIKYGLIKLVPKATNPTLPNPVTTLKVCVRDKRQAYHS